MTTPMIALALWCIAFGINVGALIADVRFKMGWVMGFISLCVIIYYVLRLEGIL